MQQFENVVDTYAGFQIRSTTHYMAGRHTVAHREEEQFVIVALIWVILIRKCSVHTTDTESFAPFQLFNEGNTIEQLPVHVISDGKRGITVIQEFHIVDKTERLIVLGDI